MADALETIRTALKDRYEVLRELGRGGMAVVYLARDLRHERQVALKVLDPEMAAAIGQKRFHREIGIAAGLLHPNIVPLFDSGAVGDTLYYVMPYLGGESLRAAIARSAPFAPADARAILGDVAAALDHAHRSGVVHRDIKPENVLLHDGRAFVTDFGIASAAGPEADRLTLTGVAIGTPAFMSPEQATGDVVDHRADLYSLGCIAFEMLTGAPPFRASSARELIARHVVDAAPRASSIREDLAPAVDAALARMLEKEPGDRFPTGAQFVAALFDGAASHEVARVAERAPEFALVGRASELARAEQLLESSQVLTVVGPGGVGKTTFARTLMSRMERRFERAAFVQLATVAGDDFVASAIAEQLRFSFAAGAPPDPQIIDYLRHKRVLLVLDNFEHVMGAAALVAEIARDAPGCRIVVTSRERLNLERETVIPLAGLPFEGAGTAPSAAEELFVARARQVDPEFSPSERDRAAIRRIGLAVDGLPLGLEIAAALVRAMSCEEIADELAKNPDTLATSRRDAPTRHRSMRAAFDFSWNLLGERERMVLARLGILRGAVDRAAAIRIGGATAAELMALLDKSLLRRTARGRYDAHPAFRVYMEERLRELPGQADLAELERARHVATLLDGAALRLRGRDAVSAAAAIGDEIDNVRAATRWAIEHGAVAELSVVADGVFEFYDRRGWSREAMELARSAANAPSLEPHHALRVTFQVREADFLFRMGDFVEAASTAERAVADARRHGLRRELALALLLSCSLQSHHGAYDRAEELLREAVPLCHELRFAEGEARALVTEAVLELRRSRPEASLRASRQGREFSLKSGDLVGLCRHTTNLAIVTAEHESPAAAKALFADALATARLVGDRREISSATHNLALCLINSGELDSVLPLLEESLSIAREIGSPLYMIYPLNSIGSMQLKRGDLAAARTALSEALGTAVRIHAYQAMHGTIEDIAELLERGGDRALAARALRMTLNHPSAMPRQRDNARARLAAWNEPEDGDGIEPSELLAHL